MNRIICYVLYLSMLMFFTSCWKEYDLPFPPKGLGECSYVKKGMAQETAIAEKNRIVAILENSKIGNSVVEVIKATTQTTKRSELGDKVKFEWGLEIIFSCDAAGIKTEERWGYNLEFNANKAMSAKINSLQAAKNKVLESDILVDRDEECDRCVDSDGAYYDCNCTTDVDYGYKLTWAQVNPGNPYQIKILNELSAIDLARRAASPASASQPPSLTDSLEFAVKILPANSAQARSALQIVTLLKKINKAPKYRHYSGKVIKRPKAKK